MENKNTIENLFNLYKNDIYKMDSKYYTNLKNIQKQEDLLYQTLNQEQKEIINKINEYNNIQTEYIHKHIFTYGFSLANKLIIESLSDK